MFACAASTSRVEIIKAAQQSAPSRR